MKIKYPKLDQTTKNERFSTDSEVTAGYNYVPDKMYKQNY
jgi:hypothetical protein